MNKKDLKAIAAKALKKHDADEVFVTSDGQAFLSENYALLNVKDKNLKVAPLRFDRTILAENTEVVTSEKQEYTVKELEQLAADATDVAQLESILSAEKAGKNRKTAIAALENRINELKTPE